MERDEFEKLAIAELDGLYRFARFLTRDGAKAEELVQDVYARAFRPQSIEGFSPRGAGMRAWLMTIARTMFYGSLEHDKADARAMERLARDTADEPGALEAPDPSRVSGVDWAKAGPALEVALNALSFELRDVLWLWAVEGMKYREIAEALGVPIGTVMSRLHRARSKAARALMSDGAVWAEIADAAVIDPPAKRGEGAMAARGHGQP